MPHMIWLAIPSVALALSLSTCTKPNANLCSTKINEPYDGFLDDYAKGKDDAAKRDANLAFVVVNSKVFCTNMQSGVDTEKHLFETNKWISQDPDSYAITRKWYKEQCQPAPSPTP